jgi:hypothetical protein
MIRYIVGIVDFGLQFTRSITIDCTGYSDADRGGDIDDRKSTSSYLIRVGGALISWRSRKQSCVALSTAEAEYVALTFAAQEAIWVSRLISELLKTPPQPSIIYEDNQSAISMANNPQFHGRSKHIAIKYHFIREEIKKGTIEIKYCTTEDMVADMLTKGLYAERFAKLSKMAGIKELKVTSDSK